MRNRPEKGNCMWKLIKKLVYGFIILQFVMFALAITSMMITLTAAGQ